VWDRATGRQLASWVTGQSIESLALSPDGKLLAAGCEDSERKRFPVKLWDLGGTPAATQLRTRPPLPGHLNTVRALVFTPEGKMVLSASMDGTLVAWDVTTGKQVREYHRPENFGFCPIQALALSGDGKTVAAGCLGDAICFWELATAKPLGGFAGRHVSVLSSEVYGVNAVAFAPDGRTLASGGADQMVRLWDVASRQERFRQGRGHRSLVTSVAFAPDGKTVASAGIDHTLRLWQVATGKEVSTCLLYPDRGPSVPSIPPLPTVCFSPDGKTLAAVRPDGIVSLRDGKTGQERHPLPLIPERAAQLGIAFVAGSPLPRSGVRRPKSEVRTPGSGTVLLSVNHMGRLLSVHDVVTGRVVQEVPVDSGHKFPRLGTFSPDGRRLAVADGYEAVQVQDVAGGPPPVALPDSGGLNVLAFSPDGKLLAGTPGSLVPVPAGDCSIRLWDPVAGKLLRRLSGPDGQVHALAFSPDGKTLASGGTDRTVRLWDLATGTEVARFSGHRSAVACLAFAPDGRLLASGSHDGTALVWNLAIRPGNQLR
jgi:WD40 repeat protein